MDKLQVWKALKMRSEWETHLLFVLQLDDIIITYFQFLSSAPCDSQGNKEHLDGRPYEMIGYLIIYEHFRRTSETQAQGASEWKGYEILKLTNKWCNVKVVNRWMNMLSMLYLFFSSSSSPYGTLMMEGWRSVS